MAKITWDDAGEKIFEAGLDRGVLYLQADNGTYPLGVGWNGLTSVSESPSGADSNKQYADNDIYANLRGKEEYSGTIEAFTYPDEFEKCDGSFEIVPGVLIGQQNRNPFGFCYRTLIGNDIKGVEFGYKLHLVYGATCSPSEKTHETMNDSPEASTMSWEFDTIPVEVTGVKGAKKTATLEIDSTQVTKADLEALEAILYGGENTDPRLPLPGEVATLFHYTAPQD